MKVCRLSRRNLQFSEEKKIQWIRFGFYVTLCSRVTETGVPVKACSFAKCAHRDSKEREREQFHGLSIVVIRACTKTVDGHGAIMEFNNATCLLSLSLSPPFFSFPLCTPFLSFSSFSFSCNDTARHRTSTRECRAKRALTGSVRRLISH